MNLKTDEIKITFGDGSPPLITGGRLARIISQMVNGSSGGIEYARVITEAKTCKLTADCGDRPDDVKLSVSLT